VLALGGWAGWERRGGDCLAGVLRRDGGRGLLAVRGERAGFLLCRLAREQAPQGPAATEVAKESPPRLLLSRGSLRETPGVITRWRGGGQNCWLRGDGS
jgi:hypothetical protein